ncbi:MAG TPA: hypothetical protein PKH28_09910 [Candidatus Competibacteraceae bacterium]|nr:hypothetical protein [Candidatus Competibacteraceae bacterium]
MNTGLESWINIAQLDSLKVGGFYCIRDTPAMAARECPLPGTAVIISCLAPAP